MLSLLQKREVNSQTQNAVSKLDRCCSNRKFDVKKQENCHKARTVKHTYIVTATEN